MPRLSTQSDNPSNIGDELQEDEEGSKEGASATFSQVFAAVVVSLGSLMIGFTMTWSSPALPSMAKNESTLHVTKEEESWIGSFMPLAGLVGGLIGGPLIEILGRRMTLSLGAIPMVVSYLIIALGTSVIFLFVGRLIAGVAVGIISLALPIYLGETIHPKVRGTLGLFPTLFGNGGILFCNFVGWFLEWRPLSFFGAAAMLPFFISSFLLPETPQWYMNKENKKKARRALRWLRGGTHADITVEYERLEELHESQKYDVQVGITTICQPNYRWPMFVALALMFFQQMSGINAFIFYTVDFFDAAGTSIDSNICSIILTGVNVLATLGATLLIDKLGRKMLLFISGVIMVVTLVAVAIYFILKPEGLGWIPLACLLGYIVGFSSGYGPVPWLMMGEILPAKIRGPAASVVTACNWFLTFVVTNRFKMLVDALKLSNVMFLFAAFVVLSLVFTHFCVPETKGRSLEEIEKIMTSGGKEPAQRRSSGYTQPSAS